MRFYIFTIVFLLAGISLSGQTSGENYIKSTEYLTDDGDEKIITVQYFDGLGRPKQIVDVKAAPNPEQPNSPTNLVTKFEYDGFGRQVKDFLPVPVRNKTDELLVSDADYNLSKQQEYHNQVWYSEKTMENSPLNRVLAQAAPGNDWAKGSGHEIEFDYSTNAPSEVWIYWMNTAGTIKKGNYKNTGKNYYDANSLYKTTTKDENGNFINEYKDKQGRVIMKRSFVEKGTTSGRFIDVISEALTPVDTYYIYDMYGNLTGVVPPLAAEQPQITNAIQDDLCYTYKYDDRNRLVEKKLPGKGWEYMVYDRQDRLVATQDANLRTQGKWLFTKYDKFGRVVYTGIYVGGANRSTVQTAANNAGTNNEKREPTLKFTKNGLGVYYTSTAFPTSFTELLSVNYYDTYTNLGFNALDQFEMQPVKNGNEQTNNLKGYPVASFLRALGTSTWEKTFTVYDTKTRVVGVYKSNHLGGFTKTESELDFRGKPIQTQTVHKRNASGVEVITKDYFTYDNRERLVKHTQSINNSTVKNLIAQNKYDRRGQLISKKVGGTQTNATDRWQEVRYNYNIRGWLTYINNPMVLVAGEGTIPPAPYDDLFAFNIRYINPTNDGESLYNGNISQTIWKTASDNTQRGYNYTYDRLNRLRRADFYKQGAGNLTAYGEFISYDLNGNITHLTRTTGDASDNDIDMDDLSYTYDKDGLSNLLVNVEDAVTTGSNEGFKDGNTDPLLDDYEYDANGNMVKDRNKGISNITYNHLNLPTQIEFEGTTNKITYLYNAAGQKLKKTVVYSDSIKIVDYLDGFQYAGGVLQFFPHPEGYVKATPTDRLNTNYGYNYVFNYTDHLGNVRLSYSKDPQTNQLKILDENHYYPFGLRHSVYSAGRLRDFEVDFSNPEEEKVFLTPVTKTDYQYKFGGKEWQDELGLGWYDYGWRNYDPALGRWMNVDPLAEKYPSISSYAYVANNPIIYIDPDGKEIIPYLYKSTDSRGKPLRTKYWSDTKFIKAMSLFGKTSYGKELISAFTDKGKSHYGIKGNGKYSNYNLEIRQIRFQNGTEQFSYLGIAEGYFTPKEIDGKLTFIMAIDVTGNVNGITETIVHELALHGHKIEEIIKIYEEGGMEAVDKFMAGKEDEEHSGVITEGSKNKGAEQYNLTRDELIKINKDLKKTFDIEREKYEKNYLREDER